MLHQRLCFFLVYYYDCEHALHHDRVRDDANDHVYAPPNVCAHPYVLICDDYRGYVYARGYDCVHAHPLFHDYANDLISVPSLCDQNGYLKLLKNHHFLLINHFFYLLYYDCENDFSYLLNYDCVHDHDHDHVNALQDGNVHLLSEE